MEYVVVITIISTSFIIESIYLRHRNTTVFTHIWCPSISIKHAPRTAKQAARQMTRLKSRYRLASGFLNLIEGRARHMSCLREKTRGCEGEETKVRSKFVNGSVLAEIRPRHPRRLPQRNERQCCYLLCCTLQFWPVLTLSPFSALSLQSQSSVCLHDCR